MQKTVIVTGGSSGIGLAIAEYFHARDYKVFNLDISPCSVGQFVECSVANEEELSSVITGIGLEHDIDVLVSNAGIHASGTIEETSTEEFDTLFDINVKGAFYATRAVLPFMRANNKGSIIYIGSDQSLIAKQHSFAYCLSKHALLAMAKTTALDYASHNIRANIVCPGTIETPLYHKAIDRYCAKSGANKNKVHAEEAALQPLGRIGQPEDVAALTYFLASDEASFITGSSHAVDGGYTTA